MKLSFRNAIIASILAISAISCHKPDDTAYITHLGAIEIMTPEGESSDAYTFAFDDYDLIQADYKSESAPLTANFNTDDIVFSNGEQFTITMNNRCVTSLKNVNPLINSDMTFNYEGSFLSKIITDNSTSTWYWENDSVFKVIEESANMTTNIDIAYYDSSNQMYQIPLCMSMALFGKLPSAIKGVHAEMTGLFGQGPKKLPYHITVTTQIYEDTAKTKLASTFTSEYSIMFYMNTNNTIYGEEFELKELLNGELKSEQTYQCLYAYYSYPVDL